MRSKNTGHQWGWSIGKSLERTEIAKGVNTGSQEAIRFQKQSVLSTGFVMQVLRAEEGVWHHKCNSIPLFLSSTGYENQSHAWLIMLLPQTFSPSITCMFIWHSKPGTLQHTACCETSSKRKEHCTYRTLCLWIVWILGEWSDTVGLRLGNSENNTWF